MNPAPTGRDGGHRAWPSVLGIGPAGQTHWTSRGQGPHLPVTQTVLGDRADIQVTLTPQG